MPQMNEVIVERYYYHIFPCLLDSEFYKPRHPIMERWNINRAGGGECLHIRTESISTHIGSSIPFHGTLGDQRSEIDALVRFHQGPRNVDLAHSVAIN